MSRLRGGIFLPVDLDQGEKEGQHNRAEKDPDDPVKGEPPENRQEEKQGREAGLPADQERFQEIIDGADHEDSPEKEDQGLAPIPG